VAALKRRVADLELTVDQLCRTAAQERDIIAYRLRELELAFP
jgi:hypothetical protein